MNLLKKIKYVFWSVFVFILPIFALAQSAPTIPVRDDIDANQAILIVLSIAKWLLVLFGAITVIVAIWAAFMFLTGGDNEEQVKKAKRILIYAIVGTVVAILSFSVVSFTESLFDTPSGELEDI